MKLAKVRQVKRTAQTFFFNLLPHHDKAVAFKEASVFAMTARSMSQTRCCYTSKRRKWAADNTKQKKQTKNPKQTRHRTVKRVPQAESLTLSSSSARRSSLPSSTSFSAKAMLHSRFRGIQKNDPDDDCKRINAKIELEQVWNRIHSQQSKCCGQCLSKTNIEHDHRSSKKNYQPMTKHLIIKKNNFDVVFSHGQSFIQHDSQTRKPEHRNTNQSQQKRFIFFCSLLRAHHKGCYGSIKS